MPCSLRVRGIVRKRDGIRALSTASANVIIAALGLDGFTGLRLTELSTKQVIRLRPSVARSED